MSRAIVASFVSLATWGCAQVALAQSADPVIFSFATVGDSRQDPATFDQTTALAIGEPRSPGEPNEPGYPSLAGSLLPQDARWLQNTKDFSFWLIMPMNVLTR